MAKDADGNEIPEYTPPNPYANVDNWDDAAWANMVRDECGTCEASFGPYAACGPGNGLG